MYKVRRLYTEGREIWAWRCLAVPMPYGFGDFALLPLCSSLGPHRGHSLSLFWLPWGVLLHTILCWSCESGRQLSQRSCAWASVPQLTRAVWGLVADGVACWSPFWLLVPASPPSARERWHLAFMERPSCCMTLTFICHAGHVLPSLCEDDREKPKPVLDPNPHHLGYLCIYLFLPKSPWFVAWHDILCCDKG